MNSLQILQTIAEMCEKHSTRAFEFDSLGKTECKIACQ